MRAADDARYEWRITADPAPPAIWADAWEALVAALAAADVPPGVMDRLVLDRTSAGGGKYSLYAMFEDRDGLTSYRLVRR